MSAISIGPGRRIFYDDLGEGAPLLLIPGMMGDRRGRENSLAEALAARHRVIAMDLRDSGEADPETEYYTMPDLAGDAAALLDNLGIVSAHVLGYSLGGMVAMQLALNYRDRIDRLVLMSTFATTFQQDGQRYQMGAPLPPAAPWWIDDPVERARATLLSVTGPKYRDRVDAGELRQLSEADRENRGTWAGTVRQMATQADHDIRVQLSEIRAPTLVLHGDADPLVRLELGEQVAEGIPGAKLLVLPGVGHLPWLEQPAEVTGAILDFLDGTNHPAP